MDRKKKRKFSLLERKKHYSNVANSEFKKRGKDVNRNPSKREEYAIGYLDGLEGFIPDDMIFRSSSYSSGNKAGVNAKKQSMKVRF